MTACVRAADVGNLLAWAWWALFFGGLAILARRQAVVRRRDARHQHQAAMRALASHRPPVTPPR